MSGTSQTIEPKFLTGTGIVKSVGGVVGYINGLSSEFLKADGSLESDNNYWKNGGNSIISLGKLGTINNFDFNLIRNNIIVASIQANKLAVTNTLQLSTTDINPTGYLTFGVGSDAIMSNTVPSSNGGNFRFQTWNGTTYNESLALKNNGLAGFNNLAPTALIHGIGKDSTSTNFVQKLENSISQSLFSVRNDGYVGIGILNATAKLHIEDNNVSTPSFYVNRTSTNAGYGLVASDIRLNAPNSYAPIALRVTNVSSTAFGSAIEANSNVTGGYFNVNANTTFAYSHDGAIKGIGVQVSNALSGIESCTYNSSRGLLIGMSNNTNNIADAGNGASIMIRRGRNDLVANISLINGDELGSIAFQGKKGIAYSGTFSYANDFWQGASIRSFVDGTPGWGGVNQMPANLVFYTNTGIANSVDVERMRISSSGNITIDSLNVGLSRSRIASNTTFGWQAMNNSTGTGIENTAIGYQALRDNTTGQSNVALGNNSLLLNQTGIQNSAMGYNSLRSNVGGSNNTAYGFYTLFNNTADNNTALGDRALYSNTTGNSNVAVGRFSLYLNLIGTSNTAIGHNCLNAVKGSNNSAIGSGAGANITSGANNCIMGSAAGAALTTGSANIILGFNIGTITTGSNNTIIGSNITTGLSSTLANTIILANGAGSVRYFCDTNGNTGIGTTTPNANAVLDVASTTKAAMLPRMTTTQKNLIPSPTGGMEVFDTTLNKKCVYGASAWETITSV